MNTGALTSVYDITRFGAVPGGAADCTRAIASAVGACSEKGGGTVYVPAGTFLTAPIRFQSNMTLYLAAGARLVFSGNIEDFPVLHSRWEGYERPVYSPLLYGKGLENVAVRGFGILDGQGGCWWERHLAGALEYPRPRFICFEDSSRILIEGVKLINSPSWTINPVRCENVVIDKVTVENPADSPNTDGINPDSCRNVRISGCQVDVGDDCITIKSGTEKSPFRTSCENITITNCTLLHGHGGIVIGSEMSGGVRNVVISNCILEGTDRGIRLKTRRGRGGVVEDIYAMGLIMKEVVCPFVIHQYYYCGEGGKEKRVSDKSPHPVTEGTPVFRGIHFSGITAAGASAAAGFIYGLPEMPVRDVTFDNVTVTMAEDAAPGIPAMMDGLEPMKKRGFICFNAKNVSFNRVIVRGHEGPAFQVEKSENVLLPSPDRQG